MSSDQISLYFGLLDSVDTPQAYAACFGTLCSAEKQRAERFAFERHRRQFIFAHGLLRLALSSSAPQVKPSEWSFVANHYGRPYIAAPAIARPLYFSLSHTEGCVACVISGCEAVGVDVEKIHARQPLFEIAWSNFSQEEVDALRALDSGGVVVRFFDYWTLKEAYLKARGTGINLPLNQFSILISPDQKIGIRFTPGISDDSKRWHFMRCSPSARHRLAIADGSGLADGLPIVVQPWPLS
jgi:4'-phosphopantetheinyl transferase